MSRRRQKQAGVNHDRWLVSYADFITLLFAFFVVLYATSQMDNKKVVQVSAAIHGAFQELGVFSGSAQGSPLRVEAAPPGAVQPVRDPNQLAGVQGETGTGHGGAGVDVDRLKRELEEALGDEINRHEIEMRVTPEGLVVSLHELGFFNSGSAELLQEGQAPLGRIAHILNVSGFQIRVEGHTDNVPIHTAQFKSNWELSTARATEVVTLLAERYGLDPQQISVAGYSQYRPVASNETEEGRKLNRRVDLVVVSKTEPASKDPLGQVGPQAKRGD
ncbi:MAG: flagellar motor protein MotB [Terriglobales bacterium]|jgi:chemotaxis protein MotB